MRVRTTSLLLATATLMTLMSCRDPSGTDSSGASLPDANPLAPTPSRTPQPEPPAPAPPLPLPGPGVTLSGRILEVLPDGTWRPVRARQVSVEVDVTDVTDPQRVGWVPVGSDGSYRVTGVLDGRFVKITGVDTTGLRPSYRFCGTNTTTRGDTVLDVPLFLPGATVPTPTLSGQVIAVVDGKQVPLAGVDVYYQSRGWGPDVSGYTDRNGQYNLCGIPPIPGTLYMVCGNGETAYSRAVDIRSNHVLDIDATKFHTCLTLFPPS